jgi:hypothetical protein
VTHARDIWWTLDFPNVFVSPGVNSRGELVPSHGASRRRLGDKILKAAGYTINESLLFIFNLALATGIFPDELKMAKVTPIYKEGEKSNCGNYRPISVLPWSVIAKILEELIFIDTACKIQPYEPLWSPLLKAGFPLAKFFARSEIFFCLYQLVPDGSSWETKDKWKIRFARKNSQVENRLKVAFRLKNDCRAPLSDENVNQVFSQIQVRVAYLFFIFVSIVRWVSKH